jgi:predicted lipid-binding transport protein (Tim44 family)
MKRMLLAVFMGLLSLSFTAADVQAKRLGGGTSSGMKRQAPATPPAQQPPPQPAATPGTTGTAAAAPVVPPKRSWMGPIAGLAAGLGIAALMSHLGMSETFGNILTIALLAIAVIWVVRVLLRRFGPAASRPALSAQGLQFAGAGMPPAAGETFGSGAAMSAAPEASVASNASTPSGTLPAGFDAAAFERAAKMIFIRMQAANDAGDLEDLRQFATPEMFAAFRLDLQDRQGGQQQTDVVKLDAQVIDFADEAARQIVSVRFHGLIREEKDAPAAAFDEVWHLVKPTDGSREWAIAGIAQNAG